MVAGVERFGRYFRKKGWITEREEDEVERDVVVKRAEMEMEEERDGKGKRRTISQWWKDRQNGGREKRKSAAKWWVRGESGTRWVVEFATAYAVVKVFLPLRIVVSVWGAPWFARGVVIPVGTGIRSFGGRMLRMVGILGKKT